MKEVNAAYDFLVGYLSQHERVREEADIGKGPEPEEEAGDLRGSASSTRGPKRGDL